MKVDIDDPRKLHQWLDIVIAQRKRQKANFEQQFGPGSAPANAATAEIEDILKIQRECTKALADAPMRK